MTSKPSYSQSIFSVNSTTGGQLKCMKESTFIRESWIQVRTFCEPSFHFAPRFLSPLPLLSFFLSFSLLFFFFFLFVSRPMLSQWDRDRAYDQFRAYPLGMSFKKKKNPPCRFSSSVEQTNSRRYRSTSCKSDRGTVRIYIQEIVFVICTSSNCEFLRFYVCKFVLCLRDANTLLILNELPTMGFSIVRVEGVSLC